MVKHQLGGERSEWHMEMCNYKNISYSELSVSHLMDMRRVPNGQMVSTLFNIRIVSLF